MLGLGDGRGIFLLSSPQETCSKAFKSLKFDYRKASILFLFVSLYHLNGLPGGSVVKNPPANAGDMGSIPGLGRSLGEGNDNPLQYSCLGNPMDRGAWWTTIHGVTKESDTTQ